jgi:3-hydroxybutyrate dehydrogenase
MTQLANKVAFITGAGSGIGKEIARLFAREGASVAVVDMNGAAGEACAAEIEDGGGRAISLTADVTDEAQVEAAVRTTIERLGNIDILISNAGIQIVHPLEEFTFAEWKRVLAVNLDGAFLSTRACYRQMIASQQGGSIIYMGSVHSKEASLLKAPYVTAKHGLIGLAKTVAKEGAVHKIRANVICPGFVRTPLVEKQIPEQARTLGISEAAVVKDVMLKRTVDGEFTSASDIAQVALLFAAFPSSALTGQSLVVSHGWFMQ